MAKAKRKYKKKAPVIGKGVELNKNEEWEFRDNLRGSTLKYDIDTKMFKLIVGDYWRYMTDIKRLIYFLKKVQKHIGG